MCGIYIIVYSSLPPPAVVFGAKMNSDYFLSSSLMSFFFSLFRMWPVPHCSNILLQSQNSNGFCGPHHHVIWLLNVLWGYVKLWSSPLCWWQTIEPTAWNQNYLLIFVAVAETLLHSPYQTAVLGKSFVHFSPWLQLWLHSGSGRLWAVPAGSWFQVLGGERDGDWRGRGQSCLKLVCRDFLGGNEVSPRRLWCRVAGGPARGYWRWNPASCSLWSSPFRSSRFILAPLPVVPILCDKCMLFIFCLLAVAPPYISRGFFSPSFSPNLFACWSPVFWGSAPATLLGMLLPSVCLGFVTALFVSWMEQVPSCPF